MITYTLILLFLGILIYELFVRFNRNGRLSNKIPGPVQIPIMGNLLAVAFSSQVDVWKTLRYYSNNYYPITRIWVGPIAYILIRHPDDIKILFSNQKVINKGSMYDYFRPFLKNGLATSSEELWHQRRKLLNPAFHFNVLQKYSEIMFQHSELMIKELKSQNKKCIETLAPLCSKVTLRIICESTMGLALNEIDPEVAQTYCDAIHKATSVIVRRGYKPYITDFMMKLCPLLPLARDTNQAVSIIKKFTDKIVKERRKYHELSNNNVTENLEDDLFKVRQKKLALIDHLLLLERDGLIDDEGIKEEVDTFTPAGHTTQYAMLFTLMLLAENEDAQEKARIEVTEIMDRNKGKLISRDLQKMPYLECCIKESMRLYPPFAQIARFVDEDIQLKHALVPANSNVIVLFYDVHRDSNFWENPETFDPDRFLPENIKNRHSLAYIPFAAGSRNCIGQRFAMNELKSLIAYILYNFYLEPVDKLANIDLIFDVLLQPSKPVQLKFIQIQKEKK